MLSVALHMLHILGIHFVHGFIERVFFSALEKKIPSDNITIYGSIMIAINMSLKSLVHSGKLLCCGASK